jgi:hypothetical protein
MINEIAFFQNRNDEELNIKLAEKLVKLKNITDIQEIVHGLDDKEKQINNDCIKVLYEIGYRSPDLIIPYIDVFLDKIKSRNNRIVWGSCIALSLIADKTCDKIMKQIDDIKRVYKTGSVITTDYCISIFAGLIKGNSKYSKEVFPILISHLENCRPKEVAQHAERASICINRSNKQLFIDVLKKRIDSLSDSQKRRVNKILKKIEEEI